MSTMLKKIEIFQIALLIFYVLGFFIAGYFLTTMFYISMALNFFILKGLLSYMFPNDMLEERAFWERVKDKLT